MAERTPLPPPGTRFHYRMVVRVLGPALFRALGGWNVTGREHIPDEEPALICPNHISYLDPPVVGIACSKRRCCFMARDSLFRIPLLGPFIRASYSYPVDRDDGGRQALRIATDLLKGGELVIIFPEGTRSHTGELLEAKAGPAFIASRAGAPVVPTAVWGTNLVMPVHGDGLHRSPVYVRFGEPMAPPEPEGGGAASKEALLAFTDKLMGRIAELQSELRGMVPPRWREHEKRMQERWRERLRCEAAEQQEANP